MTQTTKQGLVPLVFGPILKCMGIFGFPVPDDCHHVESAEISTCSRIQNQDSLQHVHTEDTQLQDTWTSPQDSTVKDAAFSSDHADTSLHHYLYDGQTTGTTDDNLVPEITDISDSDFNRDRQRRMNGDFQTVQQSKRNEPNERQTVHPIPQSKTKHTLVSDTATNKPVRPRNPRADVEKVCEPKRQEHNTGEKLCSKCRRKKILRRVVFAFMITLSVVNIGRYATVFSTVSSLDSYLVSSISNMAFYLWCLYIYITFYPAINTHLPRLLQLLQSYEDSYSVRVDCHALRRKVIHLLLGCFLCQILLTALYVSGIQTFLPSIRNFLAPFQEEEGAGLYITTCLMSLIHYLILCPYCGFGTFSLVGTYLLVKEYQYVTRQLSLLLTSREERMLKETQPAGNHRQSEQEHPVSGSHDVNIGDHSNIDRSGQTSNDDFQTMAQHPMDNRRSEQEYPVSGSHDMNTGHTANTSKAAEISEKDTVPESSPKKNPSLSPKHLRAESKKELVSGDHDMNTINPTKTSKAAESSDFNPRFARRSPQFSQTETHSHSLTNSDISSLKTASENSTEKKDRQEVKMTTSSQKISSLSPAFVYPSPPLNHVEIKFEDGSKQAYPTNTAKKHKVCPQKEKFPDEVIDVEDMEETFPNTDDSNGNPSTTQTDEEHQLRVRTGDCHLQPPEHQARDRQQHRGHTRLQDTSCRVQGRRHGNEGRSEEGEVEEVFDQLCGQHQVLCAILHRVQGCLSHVIAVAFICGIPVFCVMIYGAGSSSVQSDEAGLLGFLLTQAVMSIASTTVLGILVHDHAHGVQEVIYAADWSQFSDRLLTKVQLFSSRLSHTNIGYHVYGLFVIDRSTVLMVFGTLATYTVVVIQFQQTSVPMCHSDNNTTVLSGTPSH